MRLFKFEAFTLSEIVIVVVILGVLASFALPNYFRGLEKQRERNAAANLRQIALAAENWQAATGPGANLNSSNINTINGELRTDVMLADDEGVSINVTADRYLLSITWNSSANIAAMGDTGGTIWTEPCCQTDNCELLPNCP